MSLLNADYEADKDFWEVKFLKGETPMEFTFDIPSWLTLFADY